MTTAAGPSRSPSGCVALSPAIWSSGPTSCAIKQAFSDVAPLTDIEETDDSYLLPDVKREDLDLQVDQGQLRLTAERGQRERVGFLRHRTRTTGRFSLNIRLPAPVDSDGVGASLDHGVPTVVVPKAVKARRLRIPIGHRR